MRCSYRIGLTIACFILSGCSVNLSAVGDFAKEGSLISSNKAMLNDTAAQTEVREYDDQNNIASNFIDPTSKAFTDRLAVTNYALEALNGYMTVLAQFSANGVATVSSDFSTIGTAFKSLNVTDPKVQQGLDATSALTNILLDAAIRNDIKKLIIDSAAPVDQITAYLIDQAQTTSNTYNQAIAVNNKYWGDLTHQTSEDVKFCGQVNLCKPVYVLTNRARITDEADLSAKAAAAAAAVTAFQKIRRDNAALVNNVDHLDDAALVEILKNDEPDLLTAIRNLKTL
jgi:hypothetical protein